MGPAGGGSVPAWSRRAVVWRAVVWWAVASLSALLALWPGAVAAAQQAGGLPVVLVHGLNSTFSTWAPYLGPDGFLATIGRQGYAVGDGQAPGTMLTGDPDDPFAPTNTIAQNAEVLRDYIAGVKEETDAERVDLIAHSLGGLISRYYVDRLMSGRDVNRLIMLGTPNAGAACAVLPARLDIATPATVELRPRYVREVFNRQITRQHGVPFHTLAGTAYDNPVQSPCADVPSDLLVSVASVEATGAPGEQLPLGHSDLVDSAQAFQDFVAPTLAREPETVADTPLPPPPEELQFVTLATGHVPAGGTSEQVVNLDDVAVASFAVYDPSHSLRVSVRGASGDRIELDPVANGLIQVDDPQTLVHLGYGFDQPAPGPWRVTLHATAGTPPTGADYAVTAQVHGGAVFTASTSTLLAAPGEPVRVAALLERGGEPLAVRHAFALVRDLAGGEEVVRLTGDGERTGTWTPAREGLHSVDVVVVGEAPDGTVVERSAFLAVEVRDPEASIWRSVLPWAGAGTGVLLLLAVAGVVGYRRLGRATP